jgi:hypothetical protein
LCLPENPMGLFAVLVAFAIGRYLAGKRDAVRLLLDVELPDELAVELHTAADETNLSPERFAAQVLESEIASRRLEHTTLGRCGPRVKGERD